MQCLYHELIVINHADSIDCEYNKRFVNHSKIWKVLCSKTFIGKHTNIIY